MCSGALVKINVGGTKFEIARSTLLRIPNSRLTRLVSKANGNEGNTSGNESNSDESFYFDRNAFVFPYILDVYRRGKLHFPSYLCGPLLSEELQFWGITEDLIADCCWKTYANFAYDQSIMKEVDHVLQSGNNKENIDYMGNRNISFNSFEILQTEDYTRNGTSKDLICKKEDSLGLKINGQVRSVTQSIPQTNNNTITAMIDNYNSETNHDKSIMTKNFDETEFGSTVINKNQSHAMMENATKSMATISSNKEIYESTNCSIRFNVSRRDKSSGEDTKSDHNLRETSKAKHLQDALNKTGDSTRAQEDLCASNDQMCIETDSEKASVIVPLGSNETQGHDRAKNNKGSNNTQMAKQECTYLEQEINTHWCSVANNEALNSNGSTSMQHLPKLNHMNTAPNDQKELPPGSTKRSSRKSRKRQNKVDATCKAITNTDQSSIVPSTFSAQRVQFASNDNELQNTDQSSKHGLRLRLRQMQRSVYCFLEYPGYSVAATIWAWIFLILVLTSVAIQCLSTHPVARVSIDDQSTKRNTTTFTPVCNQTGYLVYIQTDTVQRDSLDGASFKENLYISTVLHPALRYIQRFCLATFTLEQLGRFVTCNDKRRYFRSVFNICDILSLIPMLGLELLAGIYFDRISNASVFQFGFLLSLMGVLKVVRILKFTLQYNIMRVLMLSLKASIAHIALLIVLISIGMLLFSTLIYYAEFYTDNYETIPIGFWWSIVTMTTVGYGDTHPTTGWGYVVGSMCAIVGMISTGLPLPIIANNFNSYYTYSRVCSFKNRRLKQLRNKRKALNELSTNL